MKHLRDAVIGVIVTLVLFALAEGVLWAFRLGDPEVATPLSRGFDRTVPYLVPDPVHEGGWITTFSDGKFPERHVPPKSERFRIVLFGGSNTASFRGEWLQTMLDESAGVGAYEVVNLGRSGYGSERVAIIFEQALEKLEPDLVLIYSGHNEFIERGFQMDLEEVWSSDRWRDLGELSRHSRIVNALTTVLAPEVEASDAKPERKVEEYNKFVGQTWEQTEVYFEAYRQNLRRMCAQATEQGVEVLLSTVVYNRFAMPFGDALSPSMPAKDRAEFESLRENILTALPSFLDPLLPRVGWAHVFIGDWETALRDDGGPKLPGLRPCFGVLAEADPEFTTPKPKARKVYKGLARIYARDFSAAEQRGLERAAASLERALELAPDNPTCLFEAALLGLALGAEEGTIVQRFEDAGRFDRAPRRGSRTTNDIVKSIAAEFTGDVELLDADELFAARMPMRLVGFEWMIDECHLSIGGRKVILRDFAEAIEKRSR